MAQHSGFIKLIYADKSEVYLRVVLTATAIMIKLAMQPRAHSIVIPDGLGIPGEEMYGVSLYLDAGDDEDFCTYMDGKELNLKALLMGKGK